jgi:uncharacterized protein Yka (UPF0111/DUF47 family)
MLKMIQSLRADERAFFATYAEVADRITSAARLLRDGLADPAGLSGVAAEIAVLEHEADSIVRDLSLRLDRMLFAPVDLEDIPVLGSRLDAVIDRIDETARWATTVRIADTRIHGAWPPAVRLASVLVQATECIDAAATSPKNSVLVLARCVDVRSLEAEGDDVYSAAVSGLFDGHPDPLDALKWKQLYDDLEDALDDCGAAADVIERIVLGAA